MSTYDEGTSPSLDSHRKHRTRSSRRACGLQWKGLTPFGGQVRTQSRDCDPRHGKGLRGRRKKGGDKKKERFWQLETPLFFFLRFY